MDEDLEKLNSLIKSAKSTRSIAGGMVDVVDSQDLAFLGTWNYNHRHQIDTNQSTKQQ